MNSFFSFQVKIRTSKRKLQTRLLSTLIMITIASCTMGLCSSGKEISLERKPHYVKKSGAGTQMQCAFCIAYTYILPIPTILGQLMWFGLMSSLSRQLGINFHGDLLVVKDLNLKSNKVIHTGLDFKQNEMSWSIRFLLVSQ